MDVMEEAALDEVATKVRPFVERFTRAHERTIAAVMEMADALHEAMQQIPYGDRSRAFKGAENPLPGGAVFPITIDVAERLMRLRKQPVFRDSTLTRFLPVSPTALYELVPVDPRVLAKAIRGEADSKWDYRFVRDYLRPDMTVKDARLIAQRLIPFEVRDRWGEERRLQEHAERLARMGLAVDTCTGCGKKGPSGNGVFVDLKTRLCQRCSPSKWVGRSSVSIPQWLGTRSGIPLSAYVPAVPASPVAWTIETFRSQHREFLRRQRECHYPAPTEKDYPAIARELHAAAVTYEDAATIDQPVGGEVAARELA